jgi:hypothetical protein
MGVTCKDSICLQAVGKKISVWMWEQPKIKYKVIFRGMAIVADEKMTEEEVKTEAISDLEV